MDTAIVVGASAVALLLLPRIFSFARDVLEIVRKRRALKARVASERDALEIFLRTLAPGRAVVDIDSEHGFPFEVGVHLTVDPALDLEIRRPRLSKRLKMVGAEQHILGAEGDQPDIRFDVRRAKDERGEISERLFSHAGDALTEPLAALLYRFGADAIIAKNGRLGCRFVVKELLVERVREVLETLEAVARAYARRPAIGALAERYLWLEGSSPRCPYCHVDIAEGEPNLAACSRCKTVHHAACFAEHGGCTLLGCGGR